MGAAAAALIRKSWELGIVLTPPLTLIRMAEVI
jgi:hypothetical protein